MTTGNIFPRRRALFLVSVAFAALALMSCGLTMGVLWFYWTNPSKAVGIWFPKATNRGLLQVVLATNGEERVLFAEEREVLIYFADVAWVDSGRVAVVFTCGSPNIRVAYDTEAHRHLEFDDYQEASRASIRKNYNYDASYDPMAWACGSEGVRRFAERHPFLD